MFKLVSKFKPSGDQPKAIKALVSGLNKGYGHQTLLGVTGSGKTFTIANVIQEIQKPTLVIAHNKTLAAQLTSEFRELFPNNAVHYFVSYYDYYQPEAYIPTSDTYIEKEAMINDEIDKLRHAATTSLLTRKDVIVVASVSCIYGLGEPEVYRENIMHLRVGAAMERKEFSRKLISLQYKRTNSDLTRGAFRLRGGQWEIMPPDREIVYLFETGAGKIQKIYQFDPVEGFIPGKTKTIPEVIISPAKHFITSPLARADAIKNIRKELNERLKYFDKTKQYLEAERLERRTKFDLAMMKEVGYCHGIENYSRPLTGRKPGEPPATLLDYFSARRHSAKPDFLTIIDESHVTVPQIRGMYAGDHSRKQTLIKYGFRLPSAIDNRPLTFEEFNKSIGQIIYTSATPSVYEREISDPSTGSGQIVEQIIRPTGLIDPEIILRSARGQVEDLKKRIAKIIERNKNERVLVTTLTKKMAEDLTDYLKELKMKTAYIHSDVKTLDRVKILTDFRRGKYDILIGVNLLREGLDLPEVTLVAILDADKEGFLRSETSLIQTMGRAARNVNGKVILYADVETGSIRRAIEETGRRRKLQLAYNKKHNITPKTIEKKIRNLIEVQEDPKQARRVTELDIRAQRGLKLEDIIKKKEQAMKAAAKALDFELAAIIRDEIIVLKKKMKKK